jgi:hypothetical protein
MVRGHCEYNEDVKCEGVENCELTFECHTCRRYVSYCKGYHEGDICYRCKDIRALSKEDRKGVFEFAMKRSREMQRGE